jgi:diguanylate cyclase (GGDEF)-like protein
VENQQQQDAFLEAPVPLAVVEVRQGALAAVRFANRAFANLVAYSRDDLPGLPLAELFHPDDAALLESPLEVLASRIEQMQVRVVRRGWGTVWAMLLVSIPPGGSAQSGSAVVALQDVTLWRRIEGELAHRATHDALTGLANRSMLMEQLDHSLARLGRRPGTVAVLFCDLDGFKALNDTFGHRVGDAVLQEVAGRFLDAVRSEDVVVRMGGDEFVVVCESADPGEPASVAERVRRAVEAPVRVNDRAFTISVSIGIAQVSENSGTSEDLVRRADLAMYRAKRCGRNRIEFFAPEMEEQARSRIEMVERVRSALLAGEVAIELQPVIDLGTGAWVGSEALVRIDAGDGPRLLPAQILATARRGGLIERLDASVRGSALAWLAERGAARSGQPSWVSVNTSVRELRSARFTGAVEAELAEHGLLPEQLLLELSESSIAEIQGSALVTLRRLHAMGCRIAIDDFGSGRSSLTSLRDVVADVVKIDRSFVAGLGRDDHDAAIVGAIVTVAHKLGRTVVAKGIERPEQVHILRELGCDLGQGFLVGRPQPPAGATAPRLPR